MGILVGEMTSIVDWVPVVVVVVVEVEEGGGVFFVYINIYI